MALALLLLKNPLNISQKNKNLSLSPHHSVAHQCIYPPFIFLNPQSSFSTLHSPLP
ncbi:hypothetical protein GBA52_019128 [Prunus armeniaca]|nr:hypothetical protein GBA52_019128 [Prunus armeniaca]